MSSGLYTHISRAVGSVLTAAIYNSDHQNHINNATPSKIGGYSDTVSEMQLTTDPGAVGTEDLAGGLSGELERLRFVIKRIIGKAQWYEAPDSDLSQSGVVPDGSITNVKLADVAAARIKGQAVGAATDAPVDLTGAQAHAIIDAVINTKTNRIFGLTTSNAADSANDITVGVGAARDSTDVKTMVLPATITKRIDALWTVGNNQGGLDTGAPSANATYFVHLIERVDTGVVDVLLSLSATAPTMPASYTLRRRIAPFVRISSANKPFTQRGREFLWKNSLIDLDLDCDAGVDNAAVLRLLTVPIGIQVDALITAGLRVDTAGGGSPCGGWISSPDVNDQAPQDVEALSLSAVLNICGTTSGVWNMTDLKVRTNTAGQVRSRLSTAAAGDRFGIITRGFIDEALV